MVSVCKAWFMGVYSCTWEEVLTKEDTDAEEEHPHHRQLIDQTVKGSLSLSTQANGVCCIVKAFMTADLFG